MVIVRATHGQGNGNDSKFMRDMPDDAGSRHTKRVTLLALSVVEDESSLAKTVDKIAGARSDAA